MKPIGVSSRNRAQDIKRHKIAWLESKNKAAWFGTKKENTLTQHDYRQARYNWRFPLEEEYGKHIIHWTPYTWNDNNCFWTMAKWFFTFLICLQNKCIPIVIRAH